MKKITPIFLALASFVVLSFQKSNKAEKSDDVLSKDDIEILNIIENNRKLRNSSENKAKVIFSENEEALRFHREQQQARNKSNKK